MKPSHLALFALLLLAAVGAACPPEAVDAGRDEGVGTIRISQVSDDGTLQVELEDLSVSLRALQLRLTLTGALANRVEAAGRVRHDVVEAALAGPRSGLTLVISDSRRLPLTDGAIARILVTAVATGISVDSVSAVDVAGNRVTLNVSVP